MDSEAGLEEGVHPQEINQGSSTTSPEGQLSQVRVDGGPGAASDALEKLSVDDMLEKWVGEFGWAQLLHFILVSLAWTIHGLQSLMMIFADRDPSWQCVAPSAFNALFNSSISSGAPLRESMRVLQEVSHVCTPTTLLCEMDRSLWEWVGGKGFSTVSQWDLICGDEYKKGLAQSLFFIGGLFVCVGCLLWGLPAPLAGAGVFGNLSDSILGRKGALAIACSVTAVSGFLTAAAPNFWVYVVLRAITGLSTGGVGISSFVLATEPLGPSKRGPVGMSAFYFFSLGVMVLPFLASHSASWRLLYVYASIPAILYSVLVLPFVWESPRWYLVQGRLEEAMFVLKAFATLNGKSVPPWVGLTSEERTNQTEEPVTVFRDSNTDYSGLNDSDTEFGSSKANLLQGTANHEVGPNKRSGSLFDAMRYPEIRKRMLIMVVIWFNCAIVYYGINLNVVNIGFNIYWSVFMNGLVEVPAYAITAVFLGIWGRRNMLVITMALSGICCLAGSLLFENSSTGSSAASPAAFHQPFQHLHYNNLTSSSSLPTYPFTHEQSASAYRTPLVPASMDLRSNLYMSFMGSSSFSSDPNFQETMSSTFKEDSNSRAALFRLLCGVIGVFGIAGSYNLIYIYTLELFPTVVRNAALGLTTQAAGIGAVIAPVVVALDHLHASLPFATFGVVALVGAFLALWLPETLSQPLYETMEGLENHASIKKASLLQQHVHDNDGDDS